MGRAAQFTIATAEEIAFSERFVINAFKAAAGVKLEAENGILINRASGVTYQVVPAQEREGRLPFSVHTSTATTYLVLLDVRRSEAHLLPYDRMLDEARRSQQSPHAGLLVVGQEMQMLVDWAKSAGLIVKTISCKMDGDPFSTARDLSMATPEQFVHLHNHSHYSMLDGTASPDQICERVAKNGQPGIALTDHGVMYGTWKMYKAAKEWGIKPMLGCEVYMVDDVGRRYQGPDGKDRRFEYHQTLIAMDMEGWENLCELLSTAFRDNYYYVPRIDHSQLFARNKGIICLSGCFKGMAAWHLQHFEAPQDPNDPLPYWYRRDPDHVVRVMQAYKQAFGDRYYGEIQSIDYERYMRIMPELAEVQRHVGVPSVVTNDCHCETAEDGIFQAMMTKIATTKVDDIGDKMKPTVYYLKQKSEIDTLGILTDDMFSRTCEIMDRCTLEFPKGFLFPKYDVANDVDWQAYVATKGR